MLPSFSDRQLHRNLLFFVAKMENMENKDVTIFYTGKDFLLLFPRNKYMYMREIHVPSPNVKSRAKKKKNCVDRMKKFFRHNIFANS